MNAPHSPGWLAPPVWLVLGTALFAFPAPASGQDAAAPDTASIGAGPPAAAAAPPDSASVRSDFEMDPIVINATRMRGKMIDVPFAMERLAMKDAPHARKVSVDDVLGEVPGLFLQSRYGNHDVRISMRGFGSRSNTGIRGIRILLDGIPESEPDGQTRIEAIDFQAVGSIEVVKGNASSLYTNAPGGVINFISDIDFPSPFLLNFNRFGSFGLRQNGIKVGARTDRYGLLTTYSYHTADGYREHSDDYWNIANAVVEVNPQDPARLSIYAYFASGRIRLPGSLTREQYLEDPLQANPRDVSRDTKRITTKGRLGIRFESEIGDDEIELTGYATIKYFERTAATYRIINRDGLGASVRYLHRGHLLGRLNELSGGLDGFYQFGPIEAYENINGQKGDILLGLANETIGNAGFHIADRLDLLPKRLSLLLTARYDHVFFDARNQILEVQSASRTFDGFTPKVAVNLKLTPEIAVYASYGLGFDTPAGNELDNFPTSSDPNSMLNPDLQAQHSKNFEVGIKGSVLGGPSAFPRRIGFGATVFDIRVEDEIVPFDVFGDVYFRNSAETRRTGLELGLDMELVDGLRFKGAYTYSDFVYDQYAAGTVVIDSLGNVVLVDGDFSGNVVPTVPEHNLSISLAYEHALTAKTSGFAKVYYSMTSGMWVDDANSARTHAYELVDAVLGTDTRLGRLNLLVSAGVNNVLDEAYVGFININSAAREFYEAGAPRNWFAGLDIGYQF